MSERSAQASHRKNLPAFVNSHNLAANWKSEPKLGVFSNVHSPCREYSVGWIAREKCNSGVSQAATSTGNITVCSHCYYSLNGKKKKQRTSQKDWKVVLQNVYYCWHGKLLAFHILILYFYRPLFCPNNIPPSQMKPLHWLILVQCAMPVANLWFDTQKVCFCPKHFDKNMLKT